MSQTFRKGDFVRWTSTSSGITRTKEGEIVRVIPPNDVRAVPYDKLTRAGLSRDHESYLVYASVLEDDGTKRTRKRYYWPVVRYLEHVEK